MQSHANCHRESSYSHAAKSILATLAKSRTASKSSARLEAHQPSSIRPHLSAAESYYTGGGIKRVDPRHSHLRDDSRSSSTAISLTESSFTRCNPVLSKADYTKCLSFEDHAISTIRGTAIGSPDHSIKSLPGRLAGSM